MDLFWYAVEVVIGVGLAALVLWIGYQLLVKVRFLHNPVFIPSQADQLVDALSLFSVRKGMHFIDLGSGNGTALLALARQFPLAHITGVDINPQRVWACRTLIQQQGLAARVTVHIKNLWRVDLAQFDRVYLYGSSYIMEELEQKVKLEMQSGSQLVSVRFPFPTLKPIKTKGEALLYQF